jgi:uncharacterized protein (DUF362 family)
MPSAFALQPAATPDYRVVSAFRPAAHPGMPGRYPGAVVSVHSESSVDAGTEKVNAPVVATMMAEGLRALTGSKDPRGAWNSFFSPQDVVGIKVNCSGAPGIMSTPEVVAEIVRNLLAVGLKAGQIYIYERFPGQMTAVNYGAWVPEGVHIVGVEKVRGSIRGYDPKTYVEVDFFGEEETRSHLVRLVSETFTKIINVPNMKDHGASGVTGCLKNIAYGNFSNVARSHQQAWTNTRTFIGVLAAVEPVRSKTVLHVMDGLRGVWHGGPFSPTRRFRFYPKQMMFGTDPVAIDRLLLDIIETKRLAEGGLSIWDRSMVHVKPGEGYGEPNVNRYIKEPGHVEYASGLGLGVYDLGKIRVKRIEIP